MGTKYEEFIDFKAFFSLLNDVSSLFIVSIVNLVGTYLIIYGYKLNFHHEFFQINQQNKK